MTEPYYADELVTLWHGDCRDHLLNADALPFEDTAGEAS